MVLQLTEWALSDRMPVPRAAGWTIVAACGATRRGRRRHGDDTGAWGEMAWRAGTVVAGSVMRLTAPRRHDRLSCHELITTGAVCAGGFYVPDPKLQGQLQAA